MLMIPSPLSMAIALESVKAKRLGLTLRPLIVDLRLLPLGFCFTSGILGGNYRTFKLWLIHSGRFAGAGSPSSSHISAKIAPPGSSSLFI